MSKTRLIICGGPRYPLTAEEWRTLDALSDLVDEVVCGDGTGVDSVATLWAGRNKIPVKVFKRGNDQHQQMVEYANAIMCYKGTPEDLLDIAIKTGLWVWNFKTHCRICDGRGGRVDFDENGYDVYSNCPNCYPDVEL